MSRESRVERIKFKLEHLDGFILRGHTRTPLDVMPHLKDRIGELMQPNSYAYTLAVKGVKGVKSLLLTNTSCIVQKFRSQPFVKSKDLTPYSRLLIIACGGVMETWPGGGDAWVMASDLVEKYPVFFHREIKRGLAAARTKYRLHRIQLTVRCDLPANYHRWVEMLGFRFEGLQRMSDPGRNDHYRYALIWEDVIQPS